MTSQSLHSQEKTRKPRASGRGQTHEVEDIVYPEAVRLAQEVMLRARLVDTTRPTTSSRPSGPYRVFE